jgi:hypothetical protein
MRTARFTFFTFALIVVALGTPTAADPTTLGAEEILERSIAVYAGCESHRDMGQAHVDGSSSGPDQVGLIDRRPFRTTYRRGDVDATDQLRFEFWSGDVEGFPTRWKRYVVWRDESRIRSWWSICGHEKHDTWMMALVGAAGISASSSSHISIMLLSRSPELPTFGDWPSVHDLWLKLDATRTVVGMDEIDGRPCHRIEWVPREARTLNIWIDAESFLVRQITFGETVGRTTLRYRPEVDVEIAELAISSDPDPADIAPPAELLALWP